MLNLASQNFNFSTDAGVSMQDDTRHHRYKVFFIHVIEKFNIHFSNEFSRSIDWTHDDFVSQCAVFVFGGLDTVTNIASFMAHELAINQHVQVKLREEIESILNDRDGQSVTYEDIHSMVYLDQVLTGKFNIVIRILIDFKNLQKLFANGPRQFSSIASVQNRMI